MLHAGGKFEHGNYKTAGGLHGVGASVVNALSKELVATVKRDGAQWEMRFKQGKPVGPLKKLGPARGTGTTVYFHPDPTIFPKIEFDPADHPRAARGRQLPPQGREGRLRGRGHGREGRLRARRRARRLPEEDRRASAARSRCTRRRSRWRKDNGLRVDLVLQWTESTDEHLRSYVNGIPTGSGGTHENGLRAGLGKAVRNFIETHNLSPKGVTLTAEDIREGLTGVLSVFIAGAAVPGADQGSAEQPGAAVGGRRRSVRPALEHWLNHNISVAEAIVARIILAARAREASRAAQAGGRRARARPRRG